MIRGLAGLTLIPVLGLTAACGGGSDEGDDGGTPSPASGASTPSDGSDPDGGDPKGSALSQAALERAALEAGEEAAGFRVGKPAMDVPSYDYMEYRAKPADCQPLVGLAKGAWEIDPAAEANRRVDLDGKDLGASVDIQLRSYAPGDAERVLDGLRTAGEKCANGFTEDRSLAEGPYLAVVEGPTPKPGPGVDDSATYRMSIQDVKDEKIVFIEYLTVVRSGDTTLAFRLKPLDQRDYAGVPAELIDAQIQRYVETTG